MGETNQLVTGSVVKALLVMVCVLGGEAVKAVDVQVVEQHEVAELLPPKSQVSPDETILSPQQILLIVLV